MAWVKLDENFPDHPKIVGLSDGAFRIWTSAIAYCNRLRTDGVVPVEQVPRLSSQTRYALRAAAELVRCGLWHDSVRARCISPSCPCALPALSAHLGVFPRTLGASPCSDFVVHDYFEYQPSRAELESKSVTKATSGRLGGLAKSKHRASEDPKPDPTRPDPYREAEAGVAPAPLNDQPIAVWHRGDTITVPGDLGALSEQSGGPVAAGLSPKARGLATKIVAGGPCESWEYEEAIKQLEGEGKTINAGLLGAVILRHRTETADAAAGDAPGAPDKPPIAQCWTEYEEPD